MEPNLGQRGSPGDHVVMKHARMHEWSVSMERDPEPVSFTEGERTPVTRTRPPGHGGSVLMAAMLGLAHAMGREPEPIDVVEVADSDLGIDELRLSFGDLRPLDWREES